MLNFKRKILSTLSKVLKGNYALRKADDFTLSVSKNHKDKVVKFFSDEKQK